MISIALADDHILVRDALAMLIGKMEGFTITIKAASGPLLLAQINKGKIPDIVLLSINPPVADWVETAIQLKTLHPRIKIVVLSMVKSEYLRMRLLRSGVRAYLHKDCSAAELANALRQVHYNGYYFNRHLPVDISVQKPLFFEMLLNEQQRTFLRWASTDLTHREIAERMKVSPRTVDGYRDTLFKKLDIGSRIGLVIYAVRNGFVNP